MNKLMRMGLWLGMLALLGGLAPRAEAVSATGGTVTTNLVGGTNYITHTFSTTGTINLAVSVGGAVEVYAWGGGGGGGPSNGSGTDTGGGGGAARGTAIIGTGTYVIVVGGGGNSRVYPSDAGNPVSGGGGLAGTGGAGGQGGGYSGIFSNSISQANAVLIAGGGGGAGYNGDGGAGGGTNGASGSGALFGGGATQTAGGAGGNGYGAGAALQGGTPGANGDTGGGGGGGGGYWGGGAGWNGDSPAGNSGAGGGSAYTNPVSVISGALTAGSGQTPGDSGNALRGSAGNGGAKGFAGSNGIVIVRYILDAVFIQNQPVSDLTTNSANLIATLNGTNADVYVFWDTQDRGTNFTWAYTNSPLTAFTNTAAGTTITNTAAGLTPGTAYSYRFYGTNTTSGWSGWSSAGSFFTFGTPLVDNNTNGVTGLGVGTATLNGRVTATNGAVCYGKFFWGQTDGSNDPTAWANTNDISGTVTQGVAYAVTLSNLLYGQQYYYRAAASNSYGLGWATNSIGYMTTVPIAGPAGTAGTVSYTTANSYTFAAAANNLIAGKLPIATNNTQGGNGGPISVLTDGVGPSSSATVYTMGNNGSLTYDLGTAPYGYTISNVNVYSWWADSGRENITLSNLFYSTYDATNTFTAIPGTAVSYEGGSTKAVVIYSATGSGMAVGARKIRFDFGPQENNWVGYGELEVVGAASPAATAIGIANTGVSVTSTSAVLNATLQASNAVFTVSAYYWVAGAGSSNVVTVGTFTNVASTNLSVTATNLTPGTSYAYTFLASNAATNLWAAPAASFITGDLTVQATDPTGRVTLADTAAFTVSRPAACTNDNLIVNYSLGGTATNGTNYTISPASGQVAIVKGQTSGVITVYPLNLGAPQQTVVLTLASGNYAIGAANSATCTLATIGTQYYTSQTGDWNLSATWGNSGPPFSGDAGVVRHGVWDTAVLATTNLGAAGNYAAITVATNGYVAAKAASGDIGTTIANPITFDGGKLATGGWNAPGGEWTGPITITTNGLISASGRVGSPKLSGKISGPGGITVTQPDQDWGGNGLTLNNAANDFAGAVVVTQLCLTLACNHALPTGKVVNVYSAGKIRFNVSQTYASEPPPVVNLYGGSLQMGTADTALNVTNALAVNVSAAGGTFNSAGPSWATGRRVTGPISIASGGTLNVGESRADGWNLDGQISGAGALRFYVFDSYGGSGGSVIAGTNNTHSGGTLVATFGPTATHTVTARGEGSLGTGPVTVESNTVMALDKTANANWTLTNTLAGSGTIQVENGAGTNTLTELGTVDPGTNGVTVTTNSTGILRVDGSVAFGAGSRLRIHVAGSNGVAGVDFDQLAVDHTLTNLANAVLQVNVNTNLAKLALFGQELIVVSNATAIADTFASVEWNAPWRGKVKYNEPAGTVKLIGVTAAPLPGTAILVW